MIVIMVIDRSHIEEKASIDERIQYEIIIVWFEQVNSMLVDDW
jgi:hypothetical protein